MSTRSSVGLPLIGLAATLVLAPRPGGAQQEVFPEPELWLEPVPDIALDAAAFCPTPEEKQDIDALIESLVEIDSPDYGIAPLMSGRQFAPIKSSKEMDGGIIMIHHGLKTATSVERLVAYGPRALPSPLDALAPAPPPHPPSEHPGGLGVEGPDHRVIEGEHRSGFGAGGRRGGQHRVR